MAAWNMSEVILAEGLAEVEDPPAPDLGFVNTRYEDAFMEKKNLAAAGPSPVTPWNPPDPPPPPAAALSASKKARSTLILRT